MLPRERVISALEHRTPDRVPLDFWVVPEIQDKLVAYFSPLSYREILDELGVDILSFSPKYIGPAMPKYSDGSYREPMGTIRIKVANKSSVYDEYARYPLSHANTIEDLEEFMWPDPKWWDFTSMDKAIGDSHKKYYIKMETGGLFELAWALTGMEKFFMDMIMNPEIPHYIMNRITQFYCEYVKRAMDACGDKIDMIYTYDDIAGQNGLLMSRDMLEEFIFPYHRRLNSVIKSYNKTIMYHSCGAITTVIDMLEKLPIDVLNPLQPRAKDMDFEFIKKEYGDSLSFHGGIDIQHTLVKGTPEEVREETIRAIDILGENGGYILTSAHYIQADSPIENILAMYETAKNYRLK